MVGSSCRQYIKHLLWPQKEGREMWSICLEVEQICVCAHRVREDGF